MWRPAKHCVVNQHSTNSNGSSNRRRLFSLKYGLTGLFCFVTGLCVIGGWLANRAQARREALQLVESIGGNVIFDFHYDADGFIDLERSPKEEWWNALLPDELSRGVVAINLEGCDMSHEDMEVIAGLSELRILNLKGTNVTAQSLVHLRACENLEILSLSKTLIGDEGIDSLVAIKNLQLLELSDTPVTDSGFARLAFSDTLNTIDIRRTAVTIRGLEEFTLRTKRVVGVWVSGSPAETALTNNLSIDGLAIMP